MAQPRNRLSAPMASYGRFLNRLAQAQSAPGSLYDVARARRQRAFYEEADRRAQEIGQYGRELNPFERMTATLPQSNPEGVAEVLPAVMGAQFAGGAAGAVLDDPINALANLANPRIPANVIPATVYHGSPHRINNVTPDAPYGRFDMSKIGTGEGAQAYGHGIYLAENPGVAKSYQVGLADQAVMLDGEQVGDFLHGSLSGGRTPKDEAINAYSFAAGDIDGAKELLESQARNVPAAASDAQQAIEWLDKNSGRLSVGSQGHFYTVDLPDAEIAKMLDWDAPLSEQPEGVKKALQAISDRNDIEGQAFFTAEWPGSIYEPPSGQITRPISGGDAYREFADIVGGKERASEMLRAAGIPGIRYFDAGSRAAGEGTRNFVIFDPDTVRIMSRE